MSGNSSQAQDNAAFAAFCELDSEDDSADEVCLGPAMQVRQETPVKKQKRPSLFEGMTSYVDYVTAVILYLRHTNGTSFRRLSQFFFAERAAFESTTRSTLSFTAIWSGLSFGLHEGRFWAQLPHDFRSPMNRFFATPKAVHAMKQDYDITRRIAEMDAYFASVTKARRLMQLYNSIRHDNVLGRMDPNHPSLATNTYDLLEYIESYFERKQPIESIVSTHTGPLSACTQGCQVRYKGKDRDVIGAESTCFDLTPCPAEYLHISTYPHHISATTTSTTTTTDTPLANQSPTTTTTTTTPSKERDTMDSSHADVIKPNFTSPPRRGRSNISHMSPFTPFGRAYKAPRLTASQTTPSSQHHSSPVVGASGSRAPSSVRTPVSSRKAAPSWEFSVNMAVTVPRDLDTAEEVEQYCMERIASLEAQFVNDDIEFSDFLQRMQEVPQECQTIMKQQQQQQQQQHQAAGMATTRAPAYVTRAGRSSARVIRFGDGNGDANSGTPR